MGARFSTKNTVSVAGTTVNNETKFSNVVNTGAAQDVRIYLHVALGGSGADLDVIVQTAHENDPDKFTDIAAFDPIAFDAGNQVNVIAPLAAENVGNFMRLKYSSVGSHTLEAIIEEKFGQ